MAGSIKDGPPSPSVNRSGGDQEPGDMAERTPVTESTTENNANANGVAPNDQKPAATNAKDPTRPRRKKARRACFACQRAHLTCGDERPCQRCIKRGLQDACQDGVRKKAKYLHDAPDGALMPGVGGNFYNNPNAMRSNVNLSTTGANVVKTQQNSNNNNNNNNNNNFYSPQQSNSYNVYQQNKSHDPVPPQLLQENNAMNQGSFNAQSPVSPTFNMQNPGGMASSSVPQRSPNTTTAGGPSQSQNTLGGAFFDPSDPALFNFDLASMNFGNRYGAMEFGMLGHLATGAGETPPSDTATQRGSIGRSGSVQFSTTPVTGAGFGESPSNRQPFTFGEPLMDDWSNGQTAAPGHVNVGGIYGQSGQNNMVHGQVPQQEAPHAFAIESHPPNFTSPSSTTSPPMATGYDDNSTAAAAAAFNQNNKSNLSDPNGQRSLISSLKQQNWQTGIKRRQRNPSTIYESVKEPYSYTTGFHNLTAFIQRRFSPQRTLQIAKALASIRPSFIATTKTLNRDDLIFMEKCFQRTLWEYEDFINACGTPTVVCRRTGEIAAVGKEFSILTGWKRDVLLGKEPNLNINTGGSAGPAGRGTFTPRTEPGRLQPVFIAELLDDDSVIEFYEDFAKLAFGDSRGSVMTTCKLLKYKTKEDAERERQMEASSNGKWNGKGGIAGEDGINQLGSKDGKVECSYCWTVKRDVFDIPMLIVMNFLPCI